MKNQAISKAISLCPVAVVAASSLVVLVLYCVSFFQSLACPYPITYEGIELWSGWQLGHGFNIYDPVRLTNEPWLIDIYPPLASVLGCWFKSSVPDLLFGLRACSMVSACVVALSLGMLLQSMGVRCRAISGALVFFFSCIPVWFTSLVAKPDYLSLMFQALALLLFWRQYRGMRMSSWFAWPAILCMLGFLSKQQGICMPIAIAIFLVVQRKYISACRFATLVALGLAFTVCVLQLITGGFWQALTFLGTVPIEPGNERANLLALGYDGIKVGLVCALALPHIREKNADQEALRLALVLFLVSMVLMFYGLLVPGATSNHEIGPLFALAILVGLLAERFAWFAPVIAAVSVVFVHSMLGFIAEQTGFVGRAAIGTLNRLPACGLILSEDPFWALASGKPPAMVDCTTFMNAWRFRAGGTAVIRSRIVAKAYRAIMVNHADMSSGGTNIWTPDIVRAVKANYMFSSETAGNGLLQDIYLPKP